MSFDQIFRELLVAWRTHYPVTLAAVGAGFAFSFLAYLVSAISRSEFVALAVFFALLGPLMIVAREIREGHIPASGRTG